MHASRRIEQIERSRGAVGSKMSLKGARENESVRRRSIKLDSTLFSNSYGLGTNHVLDRNLNDMGAGGGGASTLHQTSDTIFV